MKRKAFFLIALLALTMSSCIFSLFPIYTPESLVFKPDLVGLWQLGADKTYMQFESAAVLKKAALEKDRAEYEAGKAPKFDFSGIGVNQGSFNEDHREFTYRLTIIDSTEITSNNDYLRERYEAHLVLIEDQLFLDILPIRAEVNQDVSNNFFPMHTFMKIELRKDQFDIIPFDSKKLLDLFSSNLIRLRHEKVNDQVVITAQPKELQKFLARYSEDETVFEEADTYIRRGE